MIPGLSPERIRKTAFFTGHRNLSEDDLTFLPGLVRRCVSASYGQGYRDYICGGALGFDTLAAVEVLRLREELPGIRLFIAVPCATQADHWAEEDRRIYRDILDRADGFTVLSPVYYRGAMMVRNRWMADRSSLCICWLKEIRGGTASTVRYALSVEGMRVVNLAVRGETAQNDVMREESWNSMFISPFARKSAVTVPLRLLPDRRLRMKRIPDFF